MLLLGRRRHFSVLSLCVVGPLLCGSIAALGQEKELASDWHNTPDRVWVGPRYWTNPMEDWRIQDGRLECIRGGGGRSVHVLTRQLSDRAGRLEMSVQWGVLDSGQRPGNAGFLIGIEDEIDDYRARVLRGQGLFAGFSTEGKLTVGNKQQAVAVPRGVESYELRVSLVQSDSGRPEVTLKLLDAETQQNLGQLSARVSRKIMQGNLALVQNHGLGGGAANRPRFWFRRWKLQGDKLEAHPEQTFGPILWAMHTLSDSRSDDGYVLKMTAQMPPLGEPDASTVRLEAEREGDWQVLGEAAIDALSRTATFRVPNWPAEEDVAYRLAYTLTAKDGSRDEHFWKGIVRRDPVDRELIAAGFTGNTDFGFPNREIARNVAIHDADVLFFSGDQIYESVGGFGIIRSPVEPAVLNYLRKWYLLGWAFGDLMRDRVTICLPDDHDVYQGNIWGNGGNSVPSIREHPQGGYAQHVDFVNAVHRTQTDHHPDAFDPTPIKQNMSVFYGDMLYGRVSFAIIADRMFKSGPTRVADWPGRPDHQKDPNYDVSKLDQPDLELLGERQEKFLQVWGEDWRGADAKCVLSQTIFCNLANYHGGNKEFIFADLDSNGWPQSGRNRALRLMRKCFAFHYAGDQHLPSVVQHGIDEFGDAGFSFCVPSIAAGYPRSWRPDDEGRPVVNRPPGGLANTGDYHDGFGNKMTVRAIGNPAARNRPGRLKTLHDKASGYGIVRFDKDAGQIKIECYRLLTDAANPQDGDQFPGWPLTIGVLDNYARRPIGELPTLRVTGLENPVVQVIDETENEVVYTVRIRGSQWQPQVFTEHPHTVIVSEPGTSHRKKVTAVKPAAKNSQTLDVAF